MKPQESKRACGFTLLELMIALAVLATVAMAVYGSGSDRVRQLYSMEQRTLARWTAENHLAKLRLQRYVAVAGQRAKAAKEKAEERANAPNPDAVEHDRGWKADRGELSGGGKRQRVQLGDRTWRVVQDVKPTEHPLLWRLDIAVYAVEQGTDVGPVDTLTTFVGRY